MTPEPWLHIVPHTIWSPPHQGMQKMALTLLDTASKELSPGPHIHSLVFFCIPLPSPQIKCKDLLCWVCPIREDFELCPVGRCYPLQRRSLFQGNHACFSKGGELSRKVPLILS